MPFLSIYHHDSSWFEFSTRVSFNALIYGWKLYRIAFQNLPQNLNVKNARATVQRKEQSYLM